MPTLGLNNFNIVCSILGGYIALFGLVSYLVKDKFYLSEALISLLAGVILGPAARFIRPDEYALHKEENLEHINLYFCRVVLGVQLVIAGIQLPPRYIKKEWKSLAYLLGPGMITMWLITSMLVWAMVPDITFLYALAVGACVTPTDPILSNSILKGKFADKHIPRKLQRIVIAESGLNDGLGYPFLFLPLYLITFVGQGASGHTAGRAVGMWFYETWCYQILLSSAYGFICGWVAKELLHWAEKRNYVDKENFLVFALALALFVIGTDGLLGSDDVLACFVAGNAFTWDDWFRVQTADDSLQPSIDMLLNVAIFMWFGAVCPWHEFVQNDVIPIYRLIGLGILVLLLRRPPIVFLLHTRIHQIEKWRQTTIVGFFGPIGVSAIFYLYISQEYLRTSVLDEQGEQRQDAAKLSRTMMVVIWFLVVCSIVVHGLTIPIAKLGFKVPQSLSEAVNRSREDAGGLEEMSQSRDQDNQTLRRSSAAVPGDKSIDSSIAEKASTVDGKARDADDVEVEKEGLGWTYCRDVPLRNYKERFFIIKSLTAKELHLGVRNGSQATQSHNEAAVMEPFRSAENVYLIFWPINGEYFGYARMMASIDNSFDFLETLAAPNDFSINISTPATGHAPKGYIINDPARGTIFWEADRDSGASRKVLGSDRQSVDEDEP